MKSERLQSESHCSLKIKNLQKQYANNLVLGISQVYRSWKIKDEIKVREDKPHLVNQLCMVYHFKCDLCGAAYVSYTCRHLHQRFEEHKGSTGRNPLTEQHDLEPDHIYAN